VTRSLHSSAARAAVVVLLSSGLVVGLGACAEVPTPTAGEASAAAGPRPAVLVEQSERVRAGVAERALAARVAGEPDLVDAAAIGPAARFDRLRVRVDGPLPDAEAIEPVPATVVVSPQVLGWPRWFVTVTDPTADPAGSGEASAPGSAAASAPASVEPTADDGSEEAAVTQELPVIELYDSGEVRAPYRLWARMTMLPGADLPAFPAAEVGAVTFGDGATEPSEQASADPSADPSLDPSPEPSVEPGAEVDPESDPDAAADAELRAVLSGLAERYASVMADGDASEAAAQFEPDPFVEAVRARAAAEQEAVAAVADTTVSHTPFGGGEVLYAARAVNGDVLAVTAVTTTTVMTTRPGEGTLRPGTEVRAAAGIEETDGTLTTRSVAALAFVVPAEQGAIRLVAVGEGLVAAEAS
jgi:hypothetical protein